MFFTSDDFIMLSEAADEIFNNLPFESRFSAIWLKANLKPLAASFVTAWENVPCIYTPPDNADRQNSELGKYVIQELIQIAIPKRFGEDIVLLGVQYLGGIQLNDMLQDQDGNKFIVKKKFRRGYGAYYVLDCEIYKGKDDTWLKGQYHRA
jgi:hypothetical protein